MGELLSDQLPFLRAILSLVAVIGLAAGIGWLARRGGVAGLPKRQPGRVQIVSSHLLDSRARLVLVRRDGREHLLAVNPAGITVIESFDAAFPASMQEGQSR